MQRIDNKTLTASQVLLLTLKKLGIKDIFGYPGSSVLGFYDELAKQSEINHYLMQSEQSAVHAAEQMELVADNTVCLSTAHPAKFPEVIHEVLSVWPEMPSGLQNLEERQRRSERINPDESILKDFIAKNAK